MTRNKMTRVDVCDEPEIQYLCAPELFDDIRDWLMKRGGAPKTTEQDMAIYCDTKNFRLFREGIEYRIKEKKNGFRHDMKTPSDTHERAVAPDSNGILHRKELKFRSDERAPSLSYFFGQNVLRPVQDRVRKFFDKTLESKVASRFIKEKIDRVREHGAARIEYSFQTGRMETLDGRHATDLLRILELELRAGEMDGLLAEKAELEEIFTSRGLVPLAQRKIVLGLDLLVPDMDEKQLAHYQEAKRRNGMAAVAEAWEPEPELAVA